MKRGKVSTVEDVDEDGVLVWRGIGSLKQHLTPIADLTLDPKNARLHPEENLAVIQRSLDRYGQHRLAVADAGGVVRIGNGMAEAARALGWKYVAAIFVEEDELESVGRSLADNRAQESSEWERVWKMFFAS